MPKIVWDPWALKTFGTLNALLALKDTLKAFKDFKNKQKCFWSIVFWYVKFNIQYTIDWMKIQMLKNSFCAKWILQKMQCFFFCELQLIAVLLLIRNFNMSWSTRFVSQKVIQGFFIFGPVSFLLDWYFCSTKSIDSLTLKRRNFFQNYKMIFKLRKSKFWELQFFSIVTFKWIFDIPFPH